jgi:hypothetical protein
MQKPKADVALLAPVPKEHLLSGLEQCRAEGFVAFGTDAGMVLAEFKHLVDNEHSADILFYASHASTSGLPQATFRGRFVDYEGAVGGKAKSGWAKYRPVSTGGDTNWSGFYLVREIYPLEITIPIASLRKRGKKGEFKSTFFPPGRVIRGTPF